MIQRFRRILQVVRPFAGPTLRRRVLRGMLFGVSAGAVVGLLGAVALFISSFHQTFPEQLRAEPKGGQRILDRDGRLLARTRNKEGVFQVPLVLDEAGPYLAKAMVAAEDKRFLSHPGVDALSILRAGAQALQHGRVVSGASTITQQLARSTFERPRTLAGKWQEMSLALLIERELSKEDILREYLNRVHFGPHIVGARAAADHYFGKPLGSLDLAETATLAGLVRGPSLFDPSRRPDLAQEQRDRVLRRMEQIGSISQEEKLQALSLPVVLHPRPPLPGAHHWVRVVAEKGRGRQVLRTTLLGRLQRRVEELVAGRMRALLAGGASATAAAAVVLDNKTGEILAYVGSPDFRDEESGGQNDGVAAFRQPGSTLKPFVYAQAMDEMGLTAASLLPDRPQHFRTPDSFYAPQNFDRKFRGDVRLRRALSNSLNVPAVYVLEKLGGTRVLEKLRALGLSSLDQSAEHYGPALALGDGEVSLLDLASAYATLARGGIWKEPAWFLGDQAKNHRRVFSPETSAIITEILSDNAARREAFGASSALELPFPVAVKTGTSKGYRDNWTMGYTRDVTVGVWVGNFDGRPTARMTGATGAGPLFHAIMKAVHLMVRPETSPEERLRPLHDVELVQARICESTGALWTEDCPHGMNEWFAKDRLPAPAPEPTPAELAVAFPQDGMVFQFDPAVPASRQTLVLKTSGGNEEVTLVLNGTPLRTKEGRAEWPLRPGQHEVFALSARNQRSAKVRFLVN